MKKVFRLAALVMVFVFIYVTLTGCGAANTTTGDTSGNAAATTGAPSVSVPEPPQKITLTSMGYLKPEIDGLVGGDPNKAQMYEELEKRTGVHIEWIMTPPDDQDTKMMLLISSGKAPDLMRIPQTYPGGGDQAIADGLVVDLAKPENAELCPNYMKALNSQPGWKRELTNDNGQIITFGQLLVPDGSTTVCFGPMLREDWLKKVGMAVPETIQEWHDVLKAFKDQKLCKSPLTMFNWALGYSQAFVGAYGATTIGWNDTQLMPDTNDKLTFGPMQPGYKEFLATMSAWYKEGLIDPDMFTLSDWGQLDGKLTSGESGASVHFLSKVKAYTDALTGGGGAMVAAPYPVLNKGDKPLYGQGNALVWGIDSISANSKYVKEAIKYRDYGYTDEGYLLLNFGLEGKDYTMVNGEPKYTNYITDCITNPDGKNSLGLTMSQAYGLIQVDNQPTLEPLEYFKVTKLCDERNLNAVTLWKQPGLNTAILNLSFTKPEVETIKKLTDIMTYAKEMVNKFMQGTEPIGNYDAFVQKCKDMGIEEVVAAYNAAYDRYKAR